MGNEIRATILRQKKPDAKAVRALRDKKRDTKSIIAELRLIDTIRQYYGDPIERVV